MTLPVSLKVDAYTYAVKRVSKLTSADHIRLKGEHAPGELEIRIDEGMPHQHDRETFLHEAIHAVARERNLELDEGEVHQISSGMAALFIDNPEILSLFEDKK